MKCELTMAKIFFIENLSSHDNMKETGCLQEYLQYNIPMEIEYNWINEFIAEQFSTLFIALQFRGRYMAR